MGQTQIKLSYSVVKDMYTNFWHHEIPTKELIRQFLKDKQQVVSYMRDLVQDIESEGEDGDIDMSSYKKGVLELGNLMISS